jgi:hypothetical protein
LRSTCPRDELEVLTVIVSVANIVTGESWNL